MFCSTSKVVLRSTSQATRSLSSSARVWSDLAGSPPLSSGSSSTTPSLPGSLPDAFKAPAPKPTTAPSPLAPSPTGRPASSGRTFSRHAPAAYKLHVNASRNNTIISLSRRSDYEDLHSHQTIVAWVSAGSAGFKGASRGTYDAAVEASLRMFGKIDEYINPTVGPGGVRRKETAPPPTEIELVFKGFGQGRDAVFQTLRGSEWTRVSSIVKMVTDATPIKVGGTRAKKRRVV